MQGHRATVASLSDLFDLEHGSSSSNTAIDWGNLSENHDPENLLPPSNSIGFMNDQLFDDRSFDLTSNDVFSVGQSSLSRSSPANLDINSGFVGHGSEDSPLVECSDSLKPSVPDNQWFQSPNSSEPESFAGPSGSGMNLEEENEEGPHGSLEGRRMPCKRKSFEVHGGQSSRVRSPDYDQNAESSPCPGASLGYSGSSGGNLVISERAEPRLRLGARGPTARSLERLSRNFHSRLNAPSQHPSDPMVGSELLRSDLGLLLSQESSSRDMNAQAPPPELHNPAFPLSGASRSSVAGPESSQEASSSSRNTLENHPMFIPATDSRTLVQSRSLGGGSIRIPRNFPPSQTGTSSTIQPPVPHRPRPMHYPRRLSEYVRRSLSAVASEPGGGSNSYSAMASGPSGSSQDTGDGGVLGLPYSVRAFANPSEGRRRLASEIRSVLDMMRRGQGLRFEDFMILDQSVLFGVADTQDQHRDMRLDVDNMSYEELLALEERIGNVSTGLSEETILARLKQWKCVVIGSQLETEPCCICQEEYNDGEDLGTLECGHDFHKDCIKQWLMHKNLCPICKTMGLST
ncbi:probable E3 ubiquitin-protein ligase RHG1A isoform X2 [Punica granatum]|uniref:RING-type E3 ubiquitin transferase n=1 Tax=Punica granatum TaxID=22663 RepID=A0A218X7Q9_PUNGR|nr:probable E3 ubiquitin-protein ligase RHG1A isoform X2 [Punica granatum]OWM80709.1 hypothetical protein CDL15_Pgr006739 [Punica granatum]